MTADSEPKTKQLELNDKTIKRTRDVLSSMLEEISKRPIKKPAEELIRIHIDTINALTEKGATLPQIFERMDKAVGLGISANSFGAYVRRVRKEIGTGSEPKKTPERKAKDKVEAAPAARTETETPAAWNCPECASKAKRHESKREPGKHYWQCPVCGANYKDLDDKPGDKL